MDFSLTPEQLSLQARTQRFIQDVIIPYEHDERQTAHGPSEDLRTELVAHARAAGLLTPHASVHHGGLGLSHVDKAIVFEEAGYSPLGPVAMNIHAPDEGNIHLMELVATPAQQQRWLLPLVQGYTNREIAEQLGISVKTIDLYRSRVMKHMQAQTLADLVGMAIAADLVDPLALRGAAVSY